MEFLNRHGKLLFILFRTKESLSLSELSSKLDVALSTTTRDIQYLIELLPEDWKLIKDEKGNYKLIVPQNEKFESGLRRLNENNVPLQLLKKIIETKNCTNELLQLEFNLSRATLYRRINEIKDWLSDFKIELKVKSFIYFKGDERKIRAMMVQFYDIYFNDSLNEIDTFNINAFQTELNSLVSNQNIYLHMGEIRRLSILLHVIHIRSSFMRYVDYPDAELKQNESITFDITNHLYRYFPKWTERNVLKSEYLYFSYNLLAGIRAKNQTEEILMIRSKAGRSKRVEWIFNFLDSLSEHFYFHFSDDDQLLSDLHTLVQSAHMDYLLLTNTRMNYLLQYVPYFKNHPLYILINRITEEMSDTYTRDESYIELDTLQLFLLIQSSILRFKNRIRIKIALVTKTSIETSYFRDILKYKYQNQIDVYHTEYTRIDSLKLFTDLDLLISTEYVDSNQIPHLPILIASSVPTPQDFSNIDQALSTLLMKKLSNNQELISLST